MITVNNLKEVLIKIGFVEINGVFTKKYDQFDGMELKVDTNNREIIYPEKIKVWDKTSSGNFDHPENFVVLECVTRLMDKGYRPEHIELEKRWQLGRGASGGKADICVSNETGEQMLLIIECKTAGKEYNEALKKMREDGGQLFSYWQQEKSTKWLTLYASDWKDDAIQYDNTIVKCTDDANILKIAEKDKSQLTYTQAHTVQELHEVWTETYMQTTYDNLIFGNETQAYLIGIRPLCKKDLKDFTPDDKIVNRFEEILRHNNVSDKENAFNRLIALFICKLVDEIQKNDYDEVDFQYKIGTDTYETLQDRLQRLHQKGMRDFMQEEVNYIDDGYAERVFSQYGASKRKKAIEDLRKTLRILKYYTNNDFTFKDVHNEELFYQNGKVLVEVVQLFEKYRIVYSVKHQFLGDLFEKLLNKGFKQNEGQFFTPMPITRFIWDCLPLDKVLHTKEGYHVPKVIDYACGAGHFLTEAVEAVNAYFHMKQNAEQVEDNVWIEKHIFGIEKDYRLARVAKVSLYMNGAGKGQIVFGDGLEQYTEKGITNGTFDILVANPPYSVDAFKAHLKLKNNTFEILSKISNDGGEIETLFVERIAQLLKPNGVAAVILPSSILSNDSNSYVAAREQILQNFNLRAVAQFGSKTFGATGTNTVVLFLEKYNEPPKRKEQLIDTVEAILDNEINSDWEDKDIFETYLQKIQISENDYEAFCNQSLTFEQIEQIPYFAEYVAQFLASTRIRTLQSSNKFQKLSQTEQQAELLSEFYQQQKKAEHDKLYYFALVYKQNTVIITAPQDNNEQKRFLGYDWSNRRGNEGIQISTPGGMLYNNDNRAAAGTLASVVRLAYNDLQAQIAEREQYYTYARLQDMIDFNRTTFNKTIKLTADKKIEIVSKFPLVKLGDIVNIVRGVSFDKQYQSTEETQNIVLTADNITLDGHFEVVKKIYVSDTIVFDKEKQLKANDCFMCFSSGSKQHVGKLTFIEKNQPYYAGGFMGILRTKSSDIMPKYLFETLNNETMREVMRSNSSGTNIQNLSNKIGAIKIPLPPLDIQQQIVDECQKVDEEYNNSRMSIEEYRKKIAEVFKTGGVIC